MEHDHRCELCGTSVRIVSSRDGTAHYESTALSLEDAQILAEMYAARYVADYEPADDQRAKAYRDEVFQRALRGFEAGERPA